MNCIVTHLRWQSPHLREPVHIDIHHLNRVSIAPLNNSLKESSSVQEISSDAVKYTPSLYGFINLNYLFRSYTLFFQIVLLEQFFETESGQQKKIWRCC